LLLAFSVPASGRAHGALQITQRAKYHGTDQVILRQQVRPAFTRATKLVGLARLPHYREAEHKAIEIPDFDPQTLILRFTPKDLTAINPD
jgi:hypothetical protein